jgi:hypothetical protein
MLRRSSTWKTAARPSTLTSRSGCVARCGPRQGFRVSGTVVLCAGPARTDAAIVICALTCPPSCRCRTRTLMTHSVESGQAETVGFVRARERMHIRMRTHADAQATPMHRGLHSSAKYLVSVWYPSFAEVVQPHACGRALLRTPAICTNLDREACDSSSSSDAYVMWMRAGVLQVLRRGILRRGGGGIFDTAHLKSG